MTELSAAKRQAIASLLGAAPDALLSNIEFTFRAVSGPAAAFVRQSAREATLDRTARAMVFAPLLPMFAARKDGVSADVFPRRTLVALWSALAVSRNAQVRQLKERLQEGRSRVSTEALDGLCQAAALEARLHEPAALGLRDETQAQALAAYLDLAPRARFAVELVDAWTGGQLASDTVKQIRLAFDDAGEIHRDGVPRLMEILFSHLAEAGMVMRLITAIPDRVSVGALAGSELGDFGERLVRYVEDTVVELGPLLKSGTMSDAKTAAERLGRCASILNQFDLAFGGEGPWEDRLVAARKRLGSQLDGLFRGIERTADAAMPLKSIQIAGRMSRKAPDLAASPASPAAMKTLAALTLVEGSHALAPLTGSEANRQTVIRAVGERADRYAEEVLDLMQGDPHADQGAALALAGLAASFLDLTQGSDVGALVRRRMASAAINRSGFAA